MRRLSGMGSRAQGLRASLIASGHSVGPRCTEAGGRLTQSPLKGIVQEAGRGSDANRQNSRDRRGETYLQKEGTPHRALATSCPERKLNGGCSQQSYWHEGRRKGLGNAQATFGHHPLSKENALDREPVD